MYAGVHLGGEWGGIRPILFSLAPLPLKFRHFGYMPPPSTLAKTSNLPLFTIFLHSVLYYTTSYMLICCVSKRWKLQVIEACPCQALPLGKVPEDKHTLAVHIPEALSCSTGTTYMYIYMYMYMYHRMAYCTLHVHIHVHVPSDVALVPPTVHVHIHVHIHVHVHVPSDGLLYMNMYHRMACCHACYRMP